MNARESSSSSVSFMGCQTFGQNCLKSANLSKSESDF